MVKPIYVLQDASRGLGTSAGVKLVAVQPPSQGDKEWYSVDSNGKFSRSTQLRLSGQGVEKTLQLSGYVPQSQSSEHAQAVDKLRTGIRVRRGRELVEQALADRAVAIQQQLGGKKAWVVPFDAAKPVQLVEVQPDMGSRLRSFNMMLGITGAAFRTSRVLSEDVAYPPDIDLLSAWVVEADEGITAPPQLPRVSEYGGPVECAAYILCTAGLATLGRPNSLSVEEDPPYEAMPSGRIVLDLPDGAQLYVGIDAGDELLCQVYAGGKVVAEHQGLDTFTGSLNLGAAVGSVAAALVAYRELQEAAAPKAKKPRAQAKAA